MFPYNNKFNSSFSISCYYLSHTRYLSAFEITEGMNEYGFLALAVEKRVGILCEEENLAGSTFLETEVLGCTVLSQS